jgi:iron(III) transport system substrate-binding protein
VAARRSRPSRPCEGTGYEIGSMSHHQGRARTRSNAKAWYDWALTPEAQSIGAEAKAFQMPSNKARRSRRRRRAEQIKLIDYDFGQVRLLGRAQAPAVEVGQRSEGALPK